MTTARERLTIAAKWHAEVAIEIAEETVEQRAELRLKYRADWSVDQDNAFHENAIAWHQQRAADLTEILGQ